MFFYDRYPVPRRLVQETNKRDFGFLGDFRLEVGMNASFPYLVVKDCSNNLCCAVVVATSAFLMFKLVHTIRLLNGTYHACSQCVPQ